MADRQMTQQEIAALLAQAEKMIASDYFGPDFGVVARRIARGFLELAAPDDLTAELEAVSEIARETWWIWNKFGHPPRFAWSTEEGANREAQRLARKHKGKTFIVMHSVRKFRVELQEPAASDV